MTTDKEVCNFIWENKRKLHRDAVLLKKSFVGETGKARHCRQRQRLEENYRQAKVQEHFIHVKEHVHLESGLSNGKENES